LAETADRQPLYRAKLTSLVRSHFLGPDGSGNQLEMADIVFSTFPSGAIARAGDEAWILLEGDDTRGAFGAGLVAVRDVPTVHFLVDGDASQIALTALGFDPSPTVWSITGTDVAQAAPAPATLPTSEVPPPGTSPFVDILRARDLEIVVEQGVVIGELLGLEVGRVVASDDGATRLDVGVGAYDQDAFAIMNANLSPEGGLDLVCAEVRRHRDRSAEPHPINRLARERWLRAELVASPERCGLKRLAPVPSVRPRAGLKDTMATGALGTDADGNVVVVVCSVGVDLDLVPTAADLIVRYKPDRVILVLPERDQYPVITELASQLAVPTTFLSLDS